MNATAQSISAGDPFPKSGSGEAQARAGSPILRPAVCPLDCWDTCAQLAEVKDGKIIRVTGNPNHPITHGYICDKARHFHEKVYSPLRVRKPKQRIGPKGSGEFADISWAEALTLIATRFKEIIAPYGPEAILPFSYAGNLGLLSFGSLDRRFFHRLGSSRLARTVCSSAGKSALLHTYGATQGTDPEGIVHSRYIIVWGLNVLTSNLHQWEGISAARRNGAKLVVIDPYRHETARRADLHLAPRPGTDAALALGFMNVILSKGLEDRDFIAVNTVGFDALRERVREYPPERVAEITGLPADLIRQVAREYATTRPSLIRAGYGLQRHTNGGMTMRTISLLPALIGAWGQMGGGFLLSNSGAFPVNNAALERPDLLKGNPRTINMNHLGDALLAAEPPIRALYVYNSNPAVTAPDQAKVLRGLAREDLFLVVHEQVITDTARYADILLPATTHFEHTDLHTSYWHLYLQLNEPVIPPVGESKSNTEVFRLLAQTMGFAEPAFQDSDQDLLRQALHWDHPFLQGITLERLRRERFVRLNTPSQPHLPFADTAPNAEPKRLSFPTPSGKIELYSAAMAATGLDPLPAYVPLAESRDGSPDLAARYPIALVSPAAKNFLNSTFGENPTLQKQEGGGPVIFLHPEDAAPRGIADGQLVRVFNYRGSFVARASVGDTVQPGVAVSPTIWWNSFTPDGTSANQTTSQRLTDMGAGATFHTNLVEVERF
ncbi:MAG: molybdopterin oxidoreductase family protein [Firmicutes bacterium]|nr:molybdopterin oxidoreductase family protein [Bacillota bacterium]